MFRLSFGLLGCRLLQDLERAQCEMTREASVPLALPPEVFPGGS